jgi:acyl-coenzyme A thioesterase PaaI-like protein
MEKQASARNCFICGVENQNGLQLRFYISEPGKVFADYTVPLRFEGYPGIVHGGVVAAMLDEVAGRAFITGDPPRFMVTAKLTVRYRKPVPVNQPLHLIGYAKEDKGRMAIAAGEIRDMQNNLLAEAEVVLANMPSEVVERNKDWDEREWMVYPDEEENNDR